MSLELWDTRSLSDDAMCALRLRAVRARELGYSVATIADVLGVRTETVYRWCSAFNKGGEPALGGARSGRPVGSGRRLAALEEEFIRDLMRDRCPDDLGITSALWTRQAVSELIERVLGTALPIRTTGEYLSRWGFTPQKPRRKAYEQDPAEVRRWLKHEYPAIAARARREGGEIQWCDETGVRSDCQAGRGYAPAGHTPTLAGSGSRFGVNMISTVTNQGKVRWMLYTGSMDAARFVQFLERLVRRAERKIFLIVDRLSAHDAEEVHLWRQGRKDQIEIFYLPRYSPELNPDERLNCDVKGNLSRAGLPKNRQEQQASLRNFMRRLANLPDRVRRYFEDEPIQYASEA